MRFKKLMKAWKSLTGSAAEADPDGMSAVVGGSAVAIGDSTQASGQISGKMVDKGGYLLAKGSTTFVGAAQTGAGGPLAAGANTSADISGADFVFAVTFTTANLGGDSAAVRSTTKYVAIDFYGWAPAGGPVVTHVQTSLLLSGQHKAFKGAGNLANVDAAAYAQGDNSLAGTLTSSLSIEGTMSTVSGMAVMAVA